MKNAVIGFFMLVILVFSIAAVQTSENSSTRKNELDTSLGMAMKQSMEILTVNPVYHIDKENGIEEFTADFIQGFLSKTTSDSEYQIEVLNVDVEKGLLDVRVTERFKQLLGQGKVTCRKTVILEQAYKEPENFYTVSFCRKENSGLTVVKQVNIHEGDRLGTDILPQTGVELEQMRFRGWKMKKPTNAMNILYGTDNISTLFVKGEMMFEAVYEKKGASK